MSGRCVDPMSLGDPENQNTPITKCGDNGAAMYLNANKQGNAIYITVIGFQQLRGEGGGQDKE